MGGFAYFKVIFLKFPRYAEENHEESLENRSVLGIRTQYSPTPTQTWSVWCVKPNTHCVESYTNTSTMSALLANCLTPSYYKSVHQVVDFTPVSCGSDQAYKNITICRFNVSWQTQRVLVLKCYGFIVPFLEDAYGDVVWRTTVDGVCELSRADAKAVIVLRRCNSKGGI